jgi:flagellin
MTPSNTLFAAFVAMARLCEMPVSAASSFHASVNPAVYALTRLSQDIQASTYRLASGNRLYNSAEDPAAITVSARLQSQVVSLRQALLNSAQADSLLQVAYGALDSIGQILDTMKTLATTASSGAVTDNQRTFLDVDFQNLRGQIDTIASETRFNDVNLLDGSSSPFDFSVGEDSAATLSVIIGTVDSATLFGGGTPNLGTKAAAITASSDVDGAIEALQLTLRNVAGNQQALGYADDTNRASIGGATAGRNGLLNVDVPYESARHAAFVVQQQVGVAVTAQAQSFNSGLLDLLKIQLKNLNS